MHNTVIVCTATYGCQISNKKNPLYLVGREAVIRSSKITKTGMHCSDIKWDCLQYGRIFILKRIIIIISQVLYPSLINDFCSYPTSNLNAGRPLVQWISHGKVSNINKHHIVRGFLYKTLHKYFCIMLSLLQNTVTNNKEGLS